MESRSWTCPCNNDKLSIMSNPMTAKPPQTHDSLYGGGNAFRNALIAWFEDNAKDYPWRRTQDPYAILVSELMLQQTQIATVVERGFYDRWMKRFPDTRSLAIADETEVVKYWEGLGYYSRARNLHAAARIIENDLSGHFPINAKEIEKLPGVGPYTAGAVASFAYDEAAAIVDGNVSRVLARVFDLREAIDSNAGNKRVWELARLLMPTRKNEKSREYNSALMELGQSTCRPSLPNCDSCPIARFCETLDPASLPVKKPRQKSIKIEEHVIFCIDNNCVLLEQEKGTRRKGLWKLPEMNQNESSARKSNLADPILTLKYSITKYRVSLNVHTARGRESTSRKWIPLDRLDEITLGAPYRRALEQLV